MQGQCDWTIRCSSGDGITFTFDQLSTESNFDFVKYVVLQRHSALVARPADRSRMMSARSVYDGPDSSSPALVERASGSDAPRPVQASGRQMLIEYTSDNSVSGGGFSGHYSCGSVMVVDPGMMVNIVTPDAGPVAGTVNGEGVRFHLDARGGVTYQIECTLNGLSDSVLELYAPNGRDLLVENDDYGGELASFIEWTCPNDGNYIVNVRGFSPQNTGDFTLEVTSDSGSSGGSSGDPCNGGLSMAAPSAVISYQPRGQYENNVDCVWAVTCPSRGDVPSFTFTALDTENGFDWVTISDGNSISAGRATQIDQVSGNLRSLSQVSYQSSSRSMSIGFTTDGSVSGVGFEGSYACGPPASGGATCEDTIEELNGRGACNGFIAQGFSCAQRFCPSCTYASMCTRTAASVPCQHTQAPQLCCGRRCDMRLLFLRRRWRRWWRRRRPCYAASRDGGNGWTSGRLHHLLCHRGPPRNRNQRLHDLRRPWYQVRTRLGQQCSATP